MGFNLPKCQVVKVTTSRKVTNASYQLHSQVLEVVTGARYCGDGISSGLSWNSHRYRIPQKQMTLLGL